MRVRVQPGERGAAKRPGFRVVHYSLQRDHLHLMLDALGPAARRLGCETELVAARDLIERPRLTLAREMGPYGHVAHLADRLLAA